MFAAAMISLTSSQFVRTKPPRPRTFTYLSRFLLSAWIAAHASTGSLPDLRSARYTSSRRPRIIGCLMRCGEYRYQENEAPRWQPRGSWFGRSSRVRG